MIVLDTSALIFWTLDPGHLSDKARQAINDSNRIIISSISVWEIGLKIKEGQLNINTSIANYAERLNRLEKLEIVPVTVETWLKNLDLDWDHRDPADRSIVVTALLHECPLVTSDRNILSFYHAAVW